MNISTKERLVTLLVLAVIGLIAAIIWWTYREIDVANRQRQQASDIARGLSQVRLATVDYRLYHNERANVQWHAASDRVDRLLADARTSLPVQDELLGRIRERRGRVKRLFGELTSAGAGLLTGGPRDQSMRMFEAQLLSRLLTEQQENFTDIFRLNDIAAEHITDVQRRLLAIALSGLALIALIKVGVSWLIHRDVLTPVARLQRAAQQVAAGNWSFEFGKGGDDEIGQLSNSFDAMARSLRGSFAQVERSNQDLAMLNEELEVRVRERAAALVQSIKSVESGEARMAGIVNSAMDAIISIDAGQRIVLFNAAAEKMFRCSAAKALGQPLDMFVPQRFREQHRHHIVAFGKTGVTSRSMQSLGALHGLRTGGEEFPIEASISHIEVSEQKIFTVIMRDITGRLSAEKEIRQLNADLEQRVIQRTAQLEAANIELGNRRAELESLFESLPGLYLVLTPDLKIVSASDAYLEATMTTREGIVGRDLFEVFPDNPDDPGTTGASNVRASIDRVIQNAAPDTMAIQKYDIRRPDGVFEERFWSPINSPIFGVDHRIVYIVHRVEEVTEFVRQKTSPPAGATAGLRARMEQMEAEIFQSSQQVQATNRQLEIANKELEAFSYSVSHDLRAPLRSMDGFSLVLIEDYGDKLDDEGRDALKRIRAASQHMGELIDDLLRLSQVTRAELNVTRVDLSALAREIAGGMDREQPGRAVEWEIEPGLSVRADLAMMRIAMQNLLQNAWKFTSRTIKPVIRVGALERNARTVHFVADNGLGFDMANATRLFGAFQRLHNTRDFPGTGIGLAIVERIIQRHDGEIWAEAKEGEGATFFFFLGESENGSGKQDNPAG